MRGNLADLAATGLASEPTLRKWIAAQPDQPWIIKRGSNGDAYEIDIPGAIEAWNAEEARKTAEARQRAEDLRQYGLNLGLGGPAEGSAGLSIAERKALLEEELVAIKLAEKRGELVKRAEIEATFADVLVRFQQRGSTFSARLGKQIDLTRAQLTAIDRLVAKDQAELADMMENWSGSGGNGSDDPPAEVEHTALHDRG